MQSARQEGDTYLSIAEQQPPDETLLTALHHTSSMRERDGLLQLGERAVLG